jgi:hypothetical protein
MVLRRRIQDVLEDRARLANERRARAGVQPVAEQDLVRVLAHVHRRPAQHARRYPGGDSRRPLVAVDIEAGQLARIDADD